LRERIHANISPEVVEYIVNPKSGPIMFRDFRLMMEINKAHAIMLCEEKILTAGITKKIMSTLKEMEEEGPNDLTPGIGSEDLYSAIEQKLINKIGTDIGGRLHTGRSRNDLGSTVTRIAIRENFFKITEELFDLLKVLIQFAEDNKDTIMPGYTHLQPAQPTTLGHHISSICSALQRDSERILESYNRINLSPLGACAFAGTGFPINRQRTAELLGFDNIVESTLDSVASRDYVSELLYSLTMTAITLSRLAQDLYLWYSDEWSIIDIDGDIAFSSSIMPQKKNPGTIEHIKAKSGHILGSLISNLSVQKNLNFMHCRDMSVESVEPIWNALKETTGIIILTKATIKRVKVKKSVMLDRVYKNFSTATELADILVRNHNMPFRTAHSIIGNVVAKTISKGLRADDITTEIISESSVEITGSPIMLSNEELETGLNPTLNLENKSTAGSPSFSETKKLIDLNKEKLKTHESTLNSWKNKQDIAKLNLEKTVNSYI
jgi:argininosuccinate lyase|tara:strand:- start:202 stop:1686 length:1485 start_codon:yes stop_codon:yes gene_type:complete